MKWLYYIWLWLISSFHFVSSFCKLATFCTKLSSLGGFRMAPLFLIKVTPTLKFQSGCKCFMHSQAIKSLTGLLSRCVMNVPTKCNQNLARILLCCTMYNIDKENDFLNETFISNFRAVRFQLNSGAMSRQFNSVPVQFQSTSRAISEQFQSNF